MGTAQGVAIEGVIEGSSRVKTRTLKAEFANQRELTAGVFYVALTTLERVAFNGLTVEAGEG